MDWIRKIWLYAGLLLASGFAVTGGAQTTPASDPQTRARYFLEEERPFRLGALPTEQTHPKTKGLSFILRADGAEGIRMLQAVDDDLLPVATKALSSREFKQMREAFVKALRSDRRIFFSGAAASGRLGILLDTAWRRFWRETREGLPFLVARLLNIEDQTCAIMTGGDYAAIHALDAFEDFISFGYQQMEEAGIAEGDVLVAISEGGETSSVIGTIWAALDAKAKVFFVFNNPAQVLAQQVDRSRRVIAEPTVTKWELTPGPMAVAGATHMQASSINLLVVGAALEAALTDFLLPKLTKHERLALDLKPSQPSVILKNFRTLLTDLKRTNNLATLTRIVDFETRIYRDKGRVTYFPDAYMFDVLADTVERSATFSLPPFRKMDDFNAPPPWAFVKHPALPTEQAWQRMLEHLPRCLSWPGETYAELGAPVSMQENPPRIGMEELLKFGIGQEEDSSRTAVTPHAAMAVLVGEEVSRLGDAEHPWTRALLASTASYEQRAAFCIGGYLNPSWTHETFQLTCLLPESPLKLSHHLALKLAFNTLSTAAMGKSGRLIGNWMAHMDMASKKHVDRGIRLISEITGIDYDTACHALFETIVEMDAWPAFDRRSISPVARTIAKLSASKNANLTPGRNQ